MSKYNIRAIKRELEDFYGTAMFSGFPMAVVELGSLDDMSDEEIVELAKSVGINVRKYEEDYER